MYGYVYATFNWINNKIYIGQHVKEKFDEKYIGSGLLLLKAVKAHGRKHFEAFLIEECKSQKELDDAERFYIRETFAQKIGYNIAHGGQGGRKQTKESIEKMLTSRTGYKHSEETRLKMSIAQIGRKHTEETKERIRASHKGVKHSEQHCINMAKSRIGVKQNRKPILTARKATEETKYKMSISRKGKRTFGDNPKARKVLCVETGVVYDSIKRAVIETNGSKAIQSVLAGIRKTSGGYHWSYA